MALLTLTASLKRAHLFSQVLQRSGHLSETSLATHTHNTHTHNKITVTSVNSTKPAYCFHHKKEIPHSELIAVDFSAGLPLSVAVKSETTNHFKL